MIILCGGLWVVRFETKYGIFLRAQFAEDLQIHQKGDRIFLESAIMRGEQTVYIINKILTIMSAH